MEAPRTTIKAPRMQELLSFSAGIGVKFDKIELLEVALTHTSYANESGNENNERLEFLGDSVLGLVCADYLCSLLPEHQEGDLSRIKASVVSEESLAEVAHGIDLPRYIRIGHGEEMNGGRDKKAILADAMEAVIAAIYLDQGFEASRTFVLSFLREQVDKVLTGRNHNKDYKSVLQALIQKKKSRIPVYVLDHIEGPEHKPTFYVRVIIGNRTFGPASGNTKKQAEQNAAHMALCGLGVINDDLDEDA